MTKLEFALETSVSERKQCFITCRSISPFLVIQLLLAPIRSEALKFFVVSECFSIYNCISIDVASPAYAR